jgi:hypothetical protein
MWVHIPPEKPHSCDVRNMINQWHPWSSPTTSIKSKPIGTSAQQKGKNIICKKAFYKWSRKFCLILYANRLYKWSRKFYLTAQKSPDTTAYGTKKEQNYHICFSYAINPTPIRITCIYVCNSLYMQIVNRLAWKKHRNRSSEGGYLGDLKWNRYPKMGKLCISYRAFS